MTEQQLVNSIIQFINYSGKAWVWRINSGMTQSTYTNKKGMTKKRLIRMAKAGSSDIQGIESNTGRFIAIEVKKPETRKSLTRSQSMFLEDIARRGGIAGVATTEEEALALLTKGIQGNL